MLQATYPHLTVSICISFSVQRNASGPIFGLWTGQKMERRSVALPYYVEAKDTPVSHHSRKPNVESQIASLSLDAGCDARVLESGGHLAPNDHSLRFVLSSSLRHVSSLIWTIDRSNYSDGPWRTRTLSIVFPRHCLNQSQNTNGTAGGRRWARVDVEPRQRALPPRARASRPRCETQ